MPHKESKVTSNKQYKLHLRTWLFFYRIYRFLEKFKTMWELPDVHRGSTLHRTFYVAITTGSQILKTEPYQGRTTNRGDGPEMDKHTQPQKL